LGIIFGIKHFILITDFMVFSFDYLHTSMV